MTFGIDISHWQSEIDYHNVREQGIGFCYIKASQGGLTVDPAADEHWAGCVEAGIVPGFYHYADNRASAATNAMLFSRMVRSHQSSVGMLPPCLDFEGQLAEGQDNVQWIREFWTTYDTLLPTRPKMLYASAGWFEGQDLSSLPPEMYTWVASWGTMVGQPSWRDGRTVLHQYSGGATMAGVVGKVDLDYALRDLSLFVLH